MTALVALVGAIFAIHHVQGLPSDAHYDLLAPFLIVSVLVSFVVDFLLLRLVLAPLDHLDAAVDDAAQGKQHPVESCIVSDARLDRLAAAFNDMQKSLEDNAQRMRVLSQQIVYAQEAERRRIAVQLHDEIAQTLSSVLLYLKLLEKSCTPEEAQRLQNLRKLITHALGDIRQLAVELHPKMLDDWGLEAALGQRVDDLNADGSRRVTLHIVGRSPERLPRDLELTFYHVAQEALNNMAHHSHARCAHVSLQREAGCLTLEVQDDGVGFNPDVVRSGRARGLGLASMRVRLALVGGELTIESQPGSGTRVYVRSPP
jgi:signal transduction histidine kinase